MISLVSGLARKMDVFTRAKECRFPTVVLSVVPRPDIPASPRNLLEMQMLDPTLHLLIQEFWHGA